MTWIIWLTSSLAQPDTLNSTMSSNIEGIDGLAQVQSSINILDAQPLSDVPQNSSLQESSYQWQNLRLPATPTVATEFQNALFLIDTQSRIWELRTTGRWQLSLDVSEQNQIDQEDLLLDAQSSFEEFLEQEDLDSISEDDLMEENEDDVQTVVQSIEDELESAIFDPLRQDGTTSFFLIPKINNVPIATRLINIHNA